MKRIIGLLIAIVMVMGLVSLANAAGSTDTIRLTVRVTYVLGLEVLAGTDLLDFGDVAYDQTDITDSPARVENKGSGINEDFRLQITGSPSCWTLEIGGADPAAEEYALYAIFCTDTSPETADFDTTDDVVLSASLTKATADVYAITAEEESSKALNTTVGAVRNLWFRFDAPKTTVETNQQWITVTVTAEISS